MKQLIKQFMSRYLSRAEIIHRLPVSQTISRLWQASGAVRGGAVEANAG